MNKSSYIAISRDQFAQLRQAKKLVKDEFQADLSLQDQDVLDRLYEFALESESEALFNIFSELNGAQSQESANDSKPALTASEPGKKSGQSVAIGDIVDGKRCVSMYRGQPVFKPV